MMRLQKYLAQAGIASRRKAEALIEAGKVQVNGQVQRTLGVKIDPKKDRVTYQGKEVTLEEEKVVILLNKPEGIVTTTDDQFSRKTVLDLLGPEIDLRVYPVGRLDYHSCGLLLLTNDGDLANTLTHPSHHIAKTYLVTLSKAFTPRDKDQFEKGMVIDGYQTKPAEVEILPNQQVRIILHEGRNRQIRKMMDQLGHHILKLERVAIGRLNAPDLQVGDYRILNEDEIKMLRRP